MLLPRIREDIDEHKKLNFHLYLALKKALFKPAAFFKGFLLPLCEERNCTLREGTLQAQNAGFIFLLISFAAAIIGSALSKVSIPALQSSVALLHLAEMEYSGSNSMFIRVLIEKKYALPYRVIDALVAHFVQFAGEKRFAFAPPCFLS